jgi:2-polyprenyl-6-methoxyphenol hydroxylase-like FAD-dependent oxidoreductase
MAVTIVGGGIAGLTAARALRQSGIEATVFERAEDVAASQIGAGLGLAYNATRVLRRLGLADQVRAAGVVTERNEFCDWKGKVLSYWDVPDGELQLGVTRKALHEILVGSLGADALVPGKNCTGFEEEDSAVTARFEDGTSETRALLIGADGLRSVVRAQLHGDQPPRYAGFSVLRVLVPAPDEKLVPTGVFRLLWGRGACFGLYHVAPGTVYTFGWKKGPEGEHIPRGQRKDALREMFRGWAPETQALIEASEEENIHQTDINDRPPRSDWGTGRVSLAGDAAHAMTFNVGQGACQGLEDSVYLARAVGAHGETPEALRAYESERADRTKDFTKMSARAARLSLIENRVLFGLRQRILRDVGKRISKAEHKLMIDV